MNCTPLGISVSQTIFNLISKTKLLIEISRPCVNMDVLHANAEPTYLGFCLQNQHKTFWDILILWIVFLQENDYFLGWSNRCCDSHTVTATYLYLLSHRLDSSPYTSTVGRTWTTPCSITVSEAAYLYLLSHKLNVLTCTHTQQGAHALGRVPW